MKHLALLFLSLISLSFTLAAKPTSSYRYEVIIFAHTDTAGFNEEAWPDTITEPDYDLGIPIDRLGGLIPSDLKISDPGAPVAWRSLKQNKNLLSEVYARIQKSKKYRPLYYSAWLQPSLNEETAVAISISGGEQIDLSPVLANSKQLPIEVTTATNLTSELKGTLKVIREKRYLHLFVDLVYFAEPPPPPEPPAQEVLSPEAEARLEPQETPEPVAPEVLPEVEEEMPKSPYKAFQMKQDRLMRSKEPYYLDHPLIGVIIEAYPFDPDDFKL